MAWMAVCALAGLSKLTKPAETGVDPRWWATWASSTRLPGSWGPRGGVCARRGRQPEEVAGLARGHTASLPGSDPPGLLASGDGALIPYLGFALRRLPMWSWDRWDLPLGVQVLPPTRMPASFWALMLASPLPPLRPLFIWDLVCPSDCVCAFVCCLFFHLSLLLSLSLSVSLLLVSPKTIRNT